MSDDSVRSALRSSDQLVVVEAPAGCGKTYQGANYAHDAALEVGNGRVLVLTHTHAAVDAFTDGTKDRQRNVDVRTIDSLLVQIASAYHQVLGLPHDVGAWACSEPNGYGTVAAQVAALLRESRVVSRSLVDRYPIVVCDEHQDATLDQETAILALHDAGARIRIFGDPMQRIFAGRGKQAKDLDIERWKELKRKADRFESLDTPHRWKNGAVGLGQWILQARRSLSAGGAVDMRPPLPVGLKVLIADNTSARTSGYQVEQAQSAAIYSVERSFNPLLVLAAYKQTTKAVHAFFNRRLILWEGHVRDFLPGLVTAIRQNQGNPQRIGDAVVEFLENVTTGFTRNGFSSRLLQEIGNGCSQTRHGKPAHLQELARIILSNPNHRGVAAFLTQLEILQKREPKFSSICFDHRREFWEAIKVGEFDDCDEGLAEVTRRRTFARVPLPRKAISTIHKAKGLQSQNVMVMACDGKHFGDSSKARCELYVAMSRAQRTLTVVASAKDLSPLVILD